MIKGFYCKKIGVAYINLARTFIFCKTLRAHSCLLNGGLCVPVTSVYYLQIHRLSHSRGSEKSYYDILQLTPKATQAQVKDAYYRMSKAYHPDQLKVTDGKDPSIKFREITEAYEVLGNYHKRKMYDKGLLKYTVASTPSEAEKYSSTFYESRRQRSRAPSATGRTPIYNFDAWSQAHYETTRQRREEAKRDYEDLLKEHNNSTEEKKANSIVAIFAMIGLGLVFQIMFTHDTDHAKTKIR
ncbi:hypothetical protein Pmani_009509 [Petrolisthes manimaculis]|uniref:J domain-containing protein n=1 Tax=Petrolisthes manimaculis TaxID=1843537 RepID=A0AAE1Q3D6_9EUCA|nr:hypothetical protein Pmani_009509 [Petrolisthes manimaculis]